MENNQKPFNKDGTLKKQYRDMPRYPVIVNGYEKKFKNNFDKNLKKGLENIKAILNVQ